MNCYALTNKTKQNLLYSLHMGREKTPSSREIAVILDFRYNTARKILMGVIAATRNHDDVHVSVYGSHPNAPLQKGHPFRRPDGIISAYHATSRPLHPFLKSAPEAPIVFICNSVNEAPHKQCVFYCCDNTLVARAAAEVFRRHNLKNFAFLMDAQGRWLLAPFYDFTYSEGPNGWQTLSVAGEGRNPTQSDLDRLARAVGLLSPAASSPSRRD